MAKYISTTFGRISGKHGTAVAAITNGKPVLRVFTPPSNPKTLGQQTQRLKFGLVVSSLNPLRNIISIGFGSKNGFNQATSLALRNAVTGNYPDFTLNYSKVIISSGSLPQSPAASASVQPNMNVLVNWDDTVWSNGSPDDVVYVAFLNPVTKTAVFVEALAKRQDGKLTAVLPSTWSGANIHAWLFFTSDDRQLSSVSQYLGTVVPA
jgi:hypothetical protein